MLGQTERYRELAISGLTTLGTPWAPPAELLSDLDRECSLDPEKVFHKAVAVSTNAYMETILDVSRLGLGLSKNEIESLLSLWAQTVSRAAPSKKLTIPMLLHVLVHSSEAELERAFSMSALKSGAVTTTSDRISQVEDAALQAVQNLGLAWELGDNPPHDLRQLCMTLLLDIGSVFSKFIIREKNANRASAQDLEEIGIVEDGLFTPWFEMCSLMVRHERLKKSYLLSLLISYISISSERLLAQKADFNPEMHLTILLELLTEYRKRRPDYDPICVSLDFNLSDSRDADGRPLELDRATKESIGSEFDRLYAWIDPNISSSNRIRSLLRPLSPKSNQMLTMRRGGTPSAPNNVMNSGDSFNADPNLSDAYINAVALSESFNSNMKFSS
ncbi:hypothetical protein AX774_g7116 [Zancudomyces culisetae]|nr:hypothetical protein AX774_g7116 [Zancudomyces culisetae]|eukprot:OMH79466.1 hypothetical protein AX774_g7116 [Zancudomyces culisetae]